MIKAAKRSDETKGFEFISAVWWIRQTILQALTEQSRIVRLPLNRVGSLKKISHTYASQNTHNTLKSYLVDAATLSRSPSRAYSAQTPRPS